MVGLSQLTRLTNKIMMMLLVLLLLVIVVVVGFVDFSWSIFSSNTSWRIHNRPASGFSC